MRGLWLRQIRKGPSVMGVGLGEMVLCYVSYVAFEGCSVKISETSQTIGLGR